MRSRDSHRIRAGSSTFAHAAQGGLPPVRYPDTARHRLAAVTPAERSRTRWRYAPPWTVIFLGSFWRLSGEDGSE